MKSKNELFAGAGVIVRKPGSKGGDGPIKVVETEYAEQVSALFFSLKEVFEEDLDYFNRHKFYGRLAEATIAQLREGDELAAIEAAVIREACAIAAEMGSHLYFAYGSNMDADQMAQRCPKAVFAGTASLEGYSFELDSAGVATVIATPGPTVYGALWLIAASDEEQLDRYEGVASSCYRKATLSVRDEADREIGALVYISNRSPHDGVTYRSNYLDNIVRNAKRLGFSPEYVAILDAK